jgi:hypothetical protein
MRGNLKLCTLRQLRGPSLIGREKWMFVKINILELEILVVRRLATIYNRIVDLKSCINDAKNSKSNNNIILKKFSILLLDCDNKDSQRYVQ